MATMTGPSSGTMAAEDQEIVIGAQVPQRPRTVSETAETRAARR